MLHLPPLESLRFFEAAARHQSFVLAGKELGVTAAAAVGHRIRTLEGHLGAELFERRRRSVHLNRRGRAYLKEVQRILAEVHGVSELQRATPRRVRIVSVEAVAEKWLLPRLASFKAAHPGIAIELETNHRSVDPSLRDFDAWLACSGETSAPRPLTRREDTLLEETLYEEALLPVCSSALLAARGPAELRDWPLLYDLGWDADWSYWFARQGQPTPDLSRDSGYRLYSMLVQAGVGRCVGFSSLRRRSMRQCVCRPADPHDNPPPPTTALPSSATRAARALPRQRYLHADESRRCELGVMIETLRRQGLRSELNRRVQASTTSQRDHLRAQIVPLLCEAAH